ncbi:MAG: hypothetical protein WCG27_01340 [Pseudomonadota bacterium]
MHLGRILIYFIILLQILILGKITGSDINEGHPYFKPLVVISKIIN